MNILCKLFGHKPLTGGGYCGDAGYARVVSSTTDGTNTKHLYLTATCPRCGTEYRICNVHQPGQDRTVQAAPSKQGTTLNNAVALLREVSRCYTREDDLPDNLLPRIDTFCENAETP